MLRRSGKGPHHARRQGIYRQWTAKPARIADLARHGADPGAPDRRDRRGAGMGETARHAGGEMGAGHCRARRQALPVRRLHRGCEVEQAGPRLRPGGRELDTDPGPAERDHAHESGSRRAAGVVRRRLQGRLPGTHHRRGLELRLRRGPLHGGAAVAGDARGRRPRPRRPQAALYGRRRGGPRHRLDGPLGARPRRVGARPRRSGWTPRRCPCRATSSRA